MTFTLILIAVALLPALLVLLFRAHGAIAFMSLCLGSVLATYVAGDVTDFMTGIMSLDALGSGEWVKLALLVLPLLLSLLFTTRTVRGHQQLINVLPALAAGLLLVLLVEPLLPANVQEQIETNVIWDTLNNLQTAVLLAGAFFSQFFLLITGRPPKHSDKKEK